MFDIGRRRSGLCPLRRYPPPRTATACRLRPSPPPRLDWTDATPSYCADNFEGTNSKYVESIELNTTHPKAFPNSVWLLERTPGTSEKSNVTRSDRLTLFVLQHLPRRRILELLRLILSPFSILSERTRPFAESSLGKILLFYLSALFPFSERNRPSFPFIPFHTLLGFTFFRVTLVSLLKNVKKRVLWRVKWGLDWILSQTPYQRGETDLTSVKCKVVDSDYRRSRLNLIMVDCAPLNVEYERLWNELNDLRGKRVIELPLISRHFSKFGLMSCPDNTRINGIKITKMNL